MDNDGVPPVSLDYRTPTGEEPGFSSMRVILPFAAGGLLTFVPLAILDYLWTRHSGTNQTVKDWIQFESLDLLKYLGALIWGESAVLLIAIKVRQRFVRLKPAGRRWWVHSIAGFANTAAVVVVIFQTTARRQFWPVLDAGGSFLVALALAIAIAFAVATMLTPRDRSRR